MEGVGLKTLYKNLHPDITLSQGLYKRRKLVQTKGAIKFDNSKNNFNKLKLSVLRLFQE